jgi:hypothetical protein
MKNAYKAIFCVSCLFLVSSAYAGVTVKDIKWQSAPTVHSGKAVFIDTQSLSISDVAKSGKVRLAVRLLNTGAAKENGRVLRCVFSLHLIQKGSADPGLWTVPFSMDERRIAVIAPGIPMEITVQRTELQNYLKRLADTGFTPDRLRASVMLEPRRGDKLSDAMADAEVEIK